MNSLLSCTCTCARRTPFWLIMSSAERYLFLSSSKRSIVNQSPESGRYTRGFVAALREENCDDLTKTLRERSSGKISLEWDSGVTATAIWKATISWLRSAPADRKPIRSIGRNVSDVDGRSSVDVYYPLRVLRRIN